MSNAPDPVPPGRFAEFAAALGEGFCPSCGGALRNPLRFSAGHSVAYCGPCGCRWENDRRRAGDPLIGWRGRAGTTEWEIWTRNPG